MSRAYPAISPVQGPGVLPPFPDPELYMGAYSGTDPSASINGQWWYRADLNMIYQYSNGQKVPVVNLGPAIVVNGSLTLGGENVTVLNPVIVLPGSTLVTYGNVSFFSDLHVLPGGSWVSANPNASPTSSVTNSYTFYAGNVYIDGSYSTSPNNVDVVTLFSTSNTVFLCMNSLSCLIGGNVVITGMGSATISATGNILNLSNTIYVPAGSTVQIMVPVGVANTPGARVGLHVDGALLTVYGWSPTSSTTDDIINVGTLPVSLSGTGIVLQGTGAGVLPATAVPVGQSAPAGGAVYATISSATIPKDTSYTSVTVPGQGGPLVFALTSLQALSSGWTYIEVYGSNTEYYNLIAVWAGSAGLSVTPLVPYAPWVNQTNLLAGYYALRNGYYSSGTVVVSGTMYMYVTAV